jgi:E3 ubiquitin-protein ligase ATL6/9/15/31/42/55
MALKLLICPPPLLTGPPSPTLTKLPVVSFLVVKSLKGGKEDLKCSVCLEKFAEDESLHLLPKCSHVFHSECIDVWFLSHSTCLLC